MNQVWLLFKILMIILEIVCMSIHIAGSLYSAEPLPHSLIFCATFVGYLLLAIMRCMRLVSGQPTLLHPELFTTTSGMLMHFICATLAMHYAEIDFHLMFMGVEGELDHIFFRFCKKQSSACILTGTIYLLQSILLLDLIVKSPPNEDLRPMRTVTEPPVWDTSFKTMRIEERDKLARTSADIYFLGKAVDHWLCVKSKWFRQLAGGQHIMSYAEAEAEQVQINLEFFVDEKSEKEHSSSSKSVLYPQQSHEEEEKPNDDSDIKYKENNEKL